MPPPLVFQPRLLIIIAQSLRNFVEDDFEFFEYEHFRSSTIVVAGRPTFSFSVL